MLGKTKEQNPTTEMSMSNPTQTQGRVLRDYYRLGLVTHQKAVSTDEGYVLAFKLKGSKDVHVLTKARGGPRHFASLDTLVEFLRTLGGAQPTLSIDLIPSTFFNQEHS